MSYVIWANNRVDEIGLPSDNEYTEKVLQAEKPTKDKFRLLKDVKPDTFANLLGQIIDVFESSSGPLTVYFSDYTANTNLRLYEWGAGVDNSEGRDGDPHNYLRPGQKKKKEWSGPYGKMTIQLNLYDEHAHFVRANVRPNTWVLLKERSNQVR